MRGVEVEFREGCVDIWDALQTADFALSISIIGGLLHSLPA